MIHQDASAQTGSCMNTGWDLLMQILEHFKASAELDGGKVS